MEHLGWGWGVSDPRDALEQMHSFGQEKHLLEQEIGVRRQAAQQSTSRGARNLFRVHKERAPPTRRKLPATTAQVAAEGPPQAVITERPAQIEIREYDVTCFFPSVPREAIWEAVYAALLSLWEENAQWRWF